jgi:hypothetical protein
MVSSTMPKIFNLLIILAMAMMAQAQTWPSGAVCDPDAGLPGAPAGRLSVNASVASLKDDVWKDNRAAFGLALGLGRGFGLSVSSGARDLRGSGAFQKGGEDSRLGLSFWPEISSHFALGVNGNFILPTGYRKQESFYNAGNDSTGVLPAFSLMQSGGEIYTGAAWSLGPAADMNAFIGYFGTSDKTEQAFRWGLGATLRPIGEHLPLEVGYSQSIVRDGVYPNTEVLRAAVAVKLPWGFTIAPGMWADLGTDPVYGANLGLRFSAPIPGGAVLRPHAESPAESPTKLTGSVLVAPPLSELNLADRNELWQSIRNGLVQSFDEVNPLASLDLPGLPYDDRTPSAIGNTVRAIAAAHPEADWLLISKVEREEVTRKSGLSAPVPVAKAGWIAECRLIVRLVNLRTRQATAPQTVEARAVLRNTPILSLVAASDNEVLSMRDSRALTFEAYRDAGREIAKGINRGQ